MKFALAALLFFAVSCLAADDTVQSQLLAIDSAFVEGHYAQVELLALRLLQSDSPLAPNELSRVNLTAGYALIMMNREPEARDYFKRALDAEPTLTLDPVQVSPKFRMVFDEVKANYQSRNHRENPPNQKPASSPPEQRTMLSNLIIPGSGQWREGNHLRGAVYFLAQTASIAALVWQINELHDSHENYLAQTDPQSIANAYDAYSNDYALAWGAGVLAAVVYLAAQADLIVFRPEESSIEAGVNQRLNPQVKLTIHW